MEVNAAPAVIMGIQQIKVRIFSHIRSAILLSTFINGLSKSKIFIYVISFSVFYKNFSIGVTRIPEKASSAFTA